MNFNLCKYSKNNFKYRGNKLVLLLILFLTFQFGYSQDENVEIVTHRVALGETMLIISKKYLVSPTEIYRLNKKAIDGVSEGMILYIPQPIKSQDILAERNEKREKEKLALIMRQTEREAKELEAAKSIEVKEKEVVVAVNDAQENKDPNYGRREAISKLSISDKTQYIEHEVASGETLNSLSKKYGVSVEQIEKENTKVLKNGLQAGATLKMPLAKNLFINKEEGQVISAISTEDLNNGPKSEISHKVNPGETLYSIAKKYGISVNELNEFNATLLKNGLQAGQSLKVKTSKSIIVNEVAVQKPVKAQEIVNTNPVETQTDIVETTIIKHQVQPKETLYSISKKYNVSVDDIKTENQALLSKGLQSGQEIVIKVKK